MEALSLPLDMTDAVPVPEPVLTLEQMGMQWPHGAMFSALDWRVPAGAGLIHGGPSSGKTTMLRLLAGALPPTSGRILFSGLPVLPEHVFWAERESEDSQNLVVRDWWNALAARYPAWDEAALAQYIEGFSLAAHQDKAFFMLSTGSRRKAWLAAALASGAPLTLIDEPFAGLDLASGSYLVSAVAAAADKANRVIVVAHSEPMEGIAWAAQLALPDAI